MPVFVGTRDMSFFTGINREIVDEIIETDVIVFSLDIHENEVNVYNEAVEKVYRPGVKINALITHDDPSTMDDQFGPNVQQTIICAFRRLVLKNVDFYPERGDVILWNNAYYEATNVIDNQLIAGRVGLPHSIICTAVMVNRSSINIREEKNAPLTDINPDQNQVAN